MQTIGTPVGDAYQTARVMAETCCISSDNTGFRGSGQTQDRVKTWRLVTLTTCGGGTE